MTTDRMENMQMNNRWDILRASVNDAPTIARFQVDMATESAMHTDPSFKNTVDKYTKDT